jgi:hypothetical protein
VHEIAQVFGRLRLRLSYDARPRRLMVRHVLRGILLVWLGSSCGGGGGGPGQTGEPPEPPLTTGASTSTGTTGTADTGSDESGELPCGAGLECPTDQFCAAPHRAGLTEPPEDFVCMQNCVLAGSTSFWCLDDTSCCGEATCDTQYGVCELEGEGTTTGTGTETTGDSTSTGDTETTGTADTGTTSNGETESTGGTTTGTESTGAER